MKPDRKEVLEVIGDILLESEIIKGPTRGNKPFILNPKVWNRYGNQGIVLTKNLSESAEKALILAGLTKPKKIGNDMWSTTPLTDPFVIPKTAKDIAKKYLNDYIDEEDK
jgi:hypothetical protein